MTEMEIYQKLRRELSSSAAAFWDAHPDDINQGIIHAGKISALPKSFREMGHPYYSLKKETNGNIEKSAYTRAG